MGDNDLKHMVPTFCSFVGVVTASLFGFWCRSFKFAAQDNNNNPNISVANLHFGPWFQLQTTISEAKWNGGGGNEVLTVSTTHECNTWEYAPVDSKLKAARAFVVITLVLGALMTNCICFLPCCREIVSKLWYCMALLFLIVLTMFQGLTFLIFKSEACNDTVVDSRIQQLFPQQFDQSKLWEDSCQWDKGSSMNVVAIACWFLTGAMMLCIGAPSPTDDEDEDKDSNPKKEETPTDAEKEEEAPPPPPEEAQHQEEAEVELPKPKEGDDIDP